MKKFLLAIIIVCAFILTNRSPVGASWVGETDEATKSEIYTLNHSASIETYFALKDTFRSKEDTYGGSYIDDNGNLNVWYVNNLKEYKNTLSTATNNVQPIIFRKADYSYAQLQDINDKLFDSMDKLGIEILSIDEFKNRIQVVMSSDAKNESEISGYIGDDKAIIFDRIISEPVDDTTYTIRNGSALNGGNYSMAVGAVRNNQYGFITAAHCGNLGETATFSGVTMGTFRARLYGPNVDVAFVQRSSSPHTFLATNMFTDGTGYTLGTLNYVSGGFPSGTTVTKYGATTGKTTGKIKSTSVSYTINGTKFSKLVSADYYSSGGDSGGAIKVDVNAGGLGYTYCAGIHKGRYTTIFGNNYSVFSDMTLAKNALGFSRHYD